MCGINGVYGVLVRLAVLTVFKKGIGLAMVRIALVAHQKEEFVQQIRAQVSYSNNY